MESSVTGPGRFRVKIKQTQTEGGEPGGIRTTCEAAVLASPRFVSTLGHRKSKKRDTMCIPKRNEGEGSREDAQRSGQDEESLEEIQSRWKRFMSDGHLLTTWGEQLKVEEGKVHNDSYPRPTMVRNEEDWVCLNGFWQYAIRKNESAEAPGTFDGRILVPFPIESSLSGVEKRITKDDFLWYKHKFTVPSMFDKDNSRLILHFDAVDWQSVVYINGKAVGEHSGGYDAFEFDITPYLDLTSTSEQEIIVRVFDPTDEGIQPRGKQCSDPFTSTRVVAPLGMWYTPVSGIWQTVWLECVPREAYIKNLKIMPDVDNSSVQVVATVSQEEHACKYEVSVKLLSGSDVVGSATGSASGTLHVHVDRNHKPLLWSPNNPFLYDLEISLHGYSDGQVKSEPIDVVKSYTALRKVSIGPDVNGIVRLQLNNKSLFQYGILDQGWWPDGLYTAASDEAMEWDIRAVKQMGFNMIRKHVKIEPQRWYHMCDKLGMLVWQDMPNGSVPAKWKPCGAFDYMENPATPTFSKIFEFELKACVDTIFNHPCITTWVPFNEAWGQYSSVDVITWLEGYDKSRLVWVSGGNDFGAGSAIDRHVYPNPVLPPLEDRRVAVLGEFGGLGHALEGHEWSSSSSSKSWGDTSDESGEEKEDTYSTFLAWGYNQVSNLDALAQDYLNMLDQLQELAMSGLGAAVYTQLSDVERESNGLVTYDRRIIKLDVPLLRKAHRRLISAANTIVSKSHLDLVSLLQESMATLPRSHTFSGLSNLQCSGDDLQYSSDNVETPKGIPRCTSLTSLYVSTN